MVAVPFRSYRAIVTDDTLGVKKRCDVSMREHCSEAGDGASVRVAVGNCRERKTVREKLTGKDDLSGRPKLGA